MDTNVIESDKIVSVVFQELLCYGTLLTGCNYGTIIQLNIINLNLIQLNIIHLNIMKCEDLRNVLLIKHINVLLCNLNAFTGFVSPNLPLPLCSFFYLSHKPFFHDKPNQPRNKNNKNS